MNNIVYKYFNLPKDQKAKIDSMFEIYRVWNEKVNLISRKDFDNFYERHVLHSLSISMFFKFHHNTKIMDVGTGGGFPGVPLAIIYPDVDFYLIDSIRKKTLALNEIIKELGLSNVTILNNRVEDINDTFDFIVCRAVASLQKLKKWTRHKISDQSNHSFQNGLICLKGGNLKDEMKQYAHASKVYEISNSFDEEFFLKKKIIHLF